MVLPIRFGENGDVAEPTNLNAEVCFARRLLCFSLIREGIDHVNFNVTHLALRHLEGLGVSHLYGFLCSLPDRSVNGGRWRFP